MTVQVHRSPSRIITTENTEASDNDRVDELTAVLERERLVERVAREIISAMKPPGAFKIPPLLEQRRLEFGIPNEAFEHAAMFETVLLWQIHLEHTESGITKGGIHLPETHQRGALQQSPRCIVVSAGLTAMDVLRGHGSGLGHIVSIMRLAPYRRVISNYGSQEQNLYACNVGQLFDDEDVALAIQDGSKAIVFSEETKQHVVRDTETGADTVPASPKVDPGEWD